MIYIRFAGGLGNQIFQLAAGFEIQYRTNLPICLCTEELSKYSTKRDPLILDCINLSDNLSICEGSWRTTLLKKRLGKINFPIFFPFSVNNRTISQIKLQHAFYLVDDYFQDLSKISNGIGKVKLLLENKALNDNVINQSKLKIFIKSDQSHIAAIHIRRSDYCSEEYKAIFPTLGESYYLNAINVFGDNVKKLVIFSDDHTVSFDFFKKYEILHASSLMLNDFQELLLMSSFKNIVIANSTFSFWSAICNEQIKKTKVAPLSWTSMKKENEIWHKNAYEENFIIL